jgi:hypothetical protein
MHCNIISLVHEAIQTFKQKSLMHFKLIFGLRPKHFKYFNLHDFYFALMFQNIISCILNFFYSIISCVDLALIFQFLLHAFL